MNKITDSRGIWAGFR